MSDVDRFVRFCESDFGAAVMDREAAYLEGFVNPADRILDIGSGIGSIEERFPDHEIIGLDASAAMVRTARDRVDAPFIVGDARSLPIGDGRVDAVFLVSTLEFIPEIDTVLEETVRILRHEGTFVALILNTESAYVQSNLERAGSYFQRMVHRDTDALASRIGEYIDTHSEYAIGIEEPRVFETNERSEAAVLAVSGSPRQ